MRSTGEKHAKAFSSKSPCVVRQRLDHCAIRPRKAARRGFPPGQPLMPQMFTRSERYGNSRRNFEPERMLGVVHCSRRIAMPPLRKDLEYVGKMPVAHAAVGGRIDSRFLGELAD